MVYRATGGASSGYSRKNPRRHGADGGCEGNAICPAGVQQPAANLLRKQVKSATFRTGGVVLPSQLA
jgi:hypothetical protein